MKSTISSRKPGGAFFVYFPQAVTEQLLQEVFAWERSLLMRGIIGFMGR